MIFSDSEREYYRKELEAASKAGDTKRVKRLIDQIRLLGEIRDTTPKTQANLKGIEEYIKQQKALNREVNKAVEYIKQQKALNKELDEHNALNYPDNNPYGLLPDCSDECPPEPPPVINTGGLLEFLKTWTPEDLSTIDLGMIGTPSEDKMREYVLDDDDIVGFPKVFPKWPETTGCRLPPQSFRDVLRLGFKEGGWTW